MNRRHVMGLILAIIVVPVLAGGLLDPMEGGLAMLVAGALILVTWLVSRVPVPRLEWVGWLASFVAGVSAVTAAVILWNAGVTAPGGTGVPWWLWALLAGYEAAVLATLAGGIWHLVRHVKALRGAHLPAHP